MQLRRKVLATALGVGLALGTAQAGWAAPDGAVTPRSSSSKASTGKGVAVTLLTGDRVTLASATANAVAVKPAKNREGVQFAVQRAGDALYVIPHDALGLVQTGKLDRRLFDVRGLIKAGYHDASRASLPLIVTYGSGKARAATGTLSKAGVTVTRELAAVGGAAVTAPKDRATEVWSAVTTQPVIEKVWLDGQRKVSLDQSVPQIGAPAAWQAGYTGKGITVAVLDTGVDTEHPDLAGKVSEARNFSEAEEDGDTIGHGTHVASTIAGSGAASGGKYKGVAPDATIVSGKVCESFGCTESAILAGMEWAAAEKHATAVNLSLGGFDTPEIDPLEEAVNNLTAQYGTLFVIAAGNSGEFEPVSSPGSADAALTVGAVDKSDELAEFSSRGPRVGDGGLKPDITAPGVDIVAARAKGTTLDQPVDEHYVSASGTSMATPHVAGSVALLAQQHPDWKAGQLKTTLMAAAKPNPSLTAYQQGAGRVDVARAITQTVTTDPAGVSFGQPLWPHADDEPVAKTVTYHNAGSAAVTLDLAATVVGPDGEPAPAGMFTFSANQITVPAGGSAQVTVTADTRVAGPDGLYSGRLTATGGQSSVITPIGVNKEVESYNLTLSALDHNGEATGEFSGLLLGLDGFSFVDVYDEDGTATVRAPKGRYDFSTFILTSRGGSGEFEEFDIALIVQPILRLTKDMTITVDARTAKPVVSTVPERSAEPLLADVTYVHNTPEAGYGVGVIASDFKGLYVSQVGPALPPEEFSSYVSSQWAKPGPDGDFSNTPYLYAVAESIAGRLPNGYTKHYRASELATIRSDFGPAPAGHTSERIVFAELDANLGGSAAILQTSLPTRRVEYVSTTAVQWSSELWIGPLNEEEGWVEAQAILFQPAKRFEARQTYRDSWNTAPFGPLLTSGSALRFAENFIWVDVPLYSDRSGHGGFSLTDTSRTALYRNGELVGETDCSACGEFEVPAGRSNYRLEVADTRSVGDLTTQFSAAWTFRSARVTGEEPARLPLSVVRFAPALDVNNAAPSGGTFEIPVTVQRLPGAPHAGVKRLTVEISYDGGETWQKAPLRKTNSGWVANVKHPSGAGFASLRAASVDTSGNTVTQTIVNAYRLK